MNEKDTFKDTGYLSRHNFTGGGVSGYDVLSEAVEMKWILYENNDD